MHLNEIEKLSSNISVSTIVEISKKVTELLDNVEYDNKVMLITKEHIKSNLAQLISTTDNELKFKLKNPERSNSNPRNRKSRFKSSKPEVVLSGVSKAFVSWRRNFSRQSI
jgi:gas vesicle protein